MRLGELVSMIAHPLNDGQSKMRVLFQYLSGGGGGLSNVILLLGAYAREFSEDELIVVCSEGSDLSRLSSHSNVKLVFVPDGRVKEWTRFRFGFVGLRRLVEEYRADVVWSMNIGAYRKLPVPNLLALHNAYQVYPWGITRLHPGSPLRVAVLRYFFRLSLRVADGALLQTPLMADYLRRTPGAPSRIFVVPKAVESGDDVCRAELPRELADRISQVRHEGRRLWLYVAAAIPHKNHKVALDALDQLVSRGARDCLVLTISAQDAIAYGGERVATLLSEGRLIATGWVGKMHLHALYDACDGCLMPSLLESLSSSHLEAMEWSKPQIVADLPYAHDLCGDSAIYVQADSSSAWADAIEALASNPELQARLIVSGKKRISEFPETWSECARRIRQCLTSLI